MTSYFEKMLDSMVEKQPLMNVSFMVKPVDYDRLQAFAKEHQTTPSQVCRTAVTRLLEEDDMEQARR